MRKLEELAQQLHVDLRASGEIYSPYPRMYYWRCWLGDEFATVTLSIPGPPIRGLGMDLLSSMQDLANTIRGKTLYVHRGPGDPEQFKVDADLIV